jgi:hypothetical protein
VLASTANETYQRTHENDSLFRCFGPGLRCRLKGDLNTTSKREVHMPNKKVAIYTRVSTLDQHPEIQKEELIKYVKRRGWSVHKIYCDNGVSGAAERRPALDSCWKIAVARGLTSWWSGNLTVSHDRLSNSSTRWNCSEPWALPSCRARKR